MGKNRDNLIFRVACWYADRIDSVDGMITAACLRRSILSSEIDRVEPPDPPRRENYKIIYKDGRIEYRKTPPLEEDSEKDESGKVEQDKVKEKKVKKFKTWKPKNQVVIKNREELHDLLSKGHYSIISAGRNYKDAKESGMEPDDEFFEKRHQKLLRDLDKLGVPFTPAIGFYGGVEHSFLVMHDDRKMPPKAHKSVMLKHKKEPSEELVKELDNLGKKYNQNSVLHGGVKGQRMHFTTGPCEDEKCTGEGWEDAPDAEDFYTQVGIDKEGTSKFTLDVQECQEKGYFERC